MAQYAAYRRYFHFMAFPDDFDALNNPELGVAALNYEPGTFFKQSFNLDRDALYREARADYELRRAANGWPALAADASIDAYVQAYLRNASLNASYAMTIEVDLMAHLLGRPICVYDAPISPQQAAGRRIAWNANSWKFMPGVLYGAQYFQLDGGRGREPLLLLHGAEGGPPVAQPGASSSEYRELQHFRPVIGAVEMLRANDIIRRTRPSDDLASQLLQQMMGQGQ